MKLVYPVRELKNEQEYKLLIDVFKSYDLKMWEVLAFKDRVHWLVRCYTEKRNIVTGEFL